MQIRRGQQHFPTCPQRQRQTHIHTTYRDTHKQSPKQKHSPHTQEQTFTDTHTQAHTQTRPDSHTHTPRDRCVWSQTGTYVYQQHTVETPELTQTPTHKNTRPWRQTSAGDVHSFYDSSETHRRTFRHPQRGRKETQEHKDAFTCAHGLSRATDSRPFPCSALEILTGLGGQGGRWAAPPHPPEEKVDPAPRSPWTPARDSQNQRARTPHPTEDLSPWRVGGKNHLESFAL